MTKTKTNTKRVTAVILSAVIILSVFAVLGSVSAGAVSSREVQLYSCNRTFCKYGFSTYDIYVTTTGNYSNEKVTIHYNNLDTDKQWRDQDAKYVKMLDNGVKLWKANVTSYNLKYAIKYTANGRTAWNNNNGKDYTADDVIGSGAAIEVQRTGFQYNYGHEVKCVLQNYAYNKVVKVRYTTDGWKSFKDKALSYESTNKNGTENWTVDLGLSNDQISNLEYAVSYTVNGRTYWANNFGENYDCYFYVYK